MKGKSDLKMEGRKEQRDQDYQWIKTDFYEIWLPLHILAGISYSQKGSNRLLVYQSSVDGRYEPMDNVKIDERLGFWFYTLCSSPCGGFRCACYSLTYHLFRSLYVTSNSYLIFQYMGLAF